VEGEVRIKGLDDALRAMRAAFPENAEQQRRLLNQAMSAAAKRTMVPMAKQLAMVGDGSGALAESIGMRAVSKSAARRSGVAARVEMVPVRNNRKAMAMYIAHYYTARGKSVPSKMVTSGIRHGHLVEFGHAARSGGFVPARPFLWPAARAQSSVYTQNFAALLEKKTQAAVRREARKRAGK